MTLLRRHVERVPPFARRNADGRAFPSPCAAIRTTPLQYRTLRRTTDFPDFSRTSVNTDPATSPVSFARPDKIPIISPFVDRNGPMLCSKVIFIYTIWSHPDQMAQRSPAQY